MLSQDRDNVWFVDYLRAIRKDFGGDDAAYLSYLKAHRKVVVESTSRFRELSSPAAKLGWMMTYHNTVVHALEAELFDEYSARREDFLVPTPPDF